MSTMSHAQQDLLRRGFKHFNRFMLLSWRLGLGPYLSFWPEGVGRYLVLIHTGRKSGLPRRTPVNFAEIDGDYYVTAGFGKRAHWYQNIMADPSIEVWAPDGWWQATAEDVSEAEGYTDKMRAVLKGSGFAAYAAGINPHRLSDAELDAATATYRLLRIQRVAPPSGPGSPGELRWVWVPVIAAFTLLLIVKRGRK